jgi:hypothetical protein
MSPTTITRSFISIQDRKERINHHLPPLWNKDDDDVESAVVVASLAKMQVAEFTI